MREDYSRCELFHTQLNAIARQLVTTAQPSRGKQWAPQGDQAAVARRPLSDSKPLLTYRETSAQAPQGNDS